MLPYEMEIPGPSPADTENVITALETAAVFRSKGDGYEAMRWLRRAAESAGEAGDDERALALSRSVADLHEELDSELTRVGAPLRHPPSGAQTPPPPPSARSSPRASASSHAAPPPPPSSRAKYTPSTPPPTTRREGLPRNGASPGESVLPSTLSAAHTGLRNAARVAIAPVATEPGVFLVRVLADDEAPAAGGSEALVVMLDPRSTLLEARAPRGT